MGTTNENTKGVAIENLQRYLRWLSLYDDSIPSVAIDGIYDATTRDAVVSFQRMMGLEETGVVDYHTWMLLFEAYLATILEHEEPRGFSPFPRFPAGYSVGSGNRQFLVEVIQYMLNELSVQHDQIPRNAQSGLFDTDTEAGVMALQRAMLLPVTGRVDRQTWNAMVDAYHQLEAQEG